MRKLIVTLLLPVVLFISCKKTETDLPPISGNESQSFNWSHTEGSYWVYQWYAIDGTGNATLYGSPDTNIVVGDTVINSYTYTAIKTDHIFFNYDEMYWRDSSGYIVDQAGYIHFSYTAFNDTVHEIETANWFYIHHILGESIGQVNVPAGEFDVYHKRNAFELVEGVQPVACTQPLGHDSYFDSSTGMPVIQQTSFISNYFANCAYFERRLIEYHIAE
jgi:hypothetical protein